METEMLNVQTRVDTGRERCGVALVTAVLLVVVGAAGSTSAKADHSFQKNSTSRGKPPTVLFLCPHGAAKSVLASAYFQQMANERGLNVRVEAAGTDPEEQVSPAVTDHLRSKGYASPVAKPRKVTRKDIETADVIISMGCDLTNLPVRADTLQRWDDVPGPGEDFNGADEAIRRRVAALVEELLARETRAHNLRR
jgi:arsenate reductase (thioredoxin)